MFATTRPPGFRCACQLQELAGREMERHRVRVVRVEQDHVPLLVCLLQVATAVLDVDLEPRSRGRSKKR